MNIAWIPAWDLLWSIILITFFNYLFAWLLRFLITLFVKNKFKEEIAYISAFLPTFLILLLMTSNPHSKSIFVLIPYFFSLWYILAHDRNYAKNIQKFLLLLSLISVVWIGIFSTMAEIYLLFFTAFLLIFTTLPAFITYLTFTFFDKKRLIFSIAIVNKTSYTTTVEKNSRMKWLRDYQRIKKYVDTFPRKHKWIAAIIGIAILPHIGDLLWTLIVSIFKTLFLH